MQLECPFSIEASVKKMLRGRQKLIATNSQRYIKSCPYKHPKAASYAGAFKAISMWLSGDMREEKDKSVNGELGESEREKTVV